MGEFYHTGARTGETHHGRIGFITGRPDVGATPKWLAGYRDALSAAGIPVDAALVVEGDFRAPRAFAARQAARRPA